MTSHARADALDEIATAAAKVASEIAKQAEVLDDPNKLTRLKTAAEGIQAAGEAASAVSFGPQGGNMDYRYRYTADYHYTTHIGDERKPLGFEAGE